MEWLPDGTGFAYDESADTGRENRLVLIPKTQKYYRCFCRILPFVVQTGLDWVAMAKKKFHGPVQCACGSY